jgi:hypothetical protein
MVAGKPPQHVLELDVRPSRIGIGMEIRTRSARDNRSNWLEALTATGSPGRAENRST